jgi:hypothetical protein
VSQEYRRLLKLVDIVVLQSMIWFSAHMVFRYVGGALKVFNLENNNSETMKISFAACDLVPSSPERVQSIPKQSWIASRLQHWHIHLAPVKCRSCTRGKRDYANRILAYRKLRDSTGIYNPRTKFGDDVSDDFIEAKLVACKLWLCASNESMASDISASTCILLGLAQT